MLRFSFVISLLVCSSFFMARNVTHVCLSVLPTHCRPSFPLPQPLPLIHLTLLVAVFLPCVQFLFSIIFHVHLFLLLSSRGTPSHRKGRLAAWWRLGLGSDAPVCPCTKDHLQPTTRAQKPPLRPPNIAQSLLYPLPSPPSLRTTHEILFFSLDNHFLHIGCPSACIVPQTVDLLNLTNTRLAPSVNPDIRAKGRAGRLAIEAKVA